MSNETEEFEVERIISKEYRNGSPWYQVKWLGFGEEHNTLLPIDRLNCDDLIEEFENAE